MQKEELLKSSIVLSKHDNEILKRNMINTSQMVRYMTREYIKKKGLK